MPDRNTSELLVVAALTGAVVMDLYHTRRNRKIVKAATMHINVLEGICELRDRQVEYLINIAKRSEVELDQFDAIALTNLDLIKDQD